MITDKAPSTTVRAIADFLKASGEECSIIPGPKMAAMFPGAQFGPETEGVLVKESCYRPDKVLQILQVGRSMLSLMRVVCLEPPLPTNLYVERDM